MHETTIAATPERPAFAAGDRVRIVESPIAAHRGVRGTIEQCYRSKRDGSDLCLIRLDSGTPTTYDARALEREDS